MIFVQIFERGTLFKYTIKWKISIIYDNGILGLKVFFSLSRDYGY